MAEPREESASLSRSGAPWEWAILLLLMANVWIWGVQPALVMDDAFFFVRYAENILSGSGYAWNPGGPPTPGLTSPSWLVVVMGAYLFWPPDQPVSLLIGVLSAVSVFALFAIMYLAARRVLPRGWSAAALAAPLFPFITKIDIAPIANSGMETGFAAAVLVLYFHIVGKPWLDGSIARWSNARVAGVGLFGLMLFTTRPEFGLVAALTPGLMYLLSWKNETVRSRLFLLLAFWVIAMEIYTAVHLLYFGELLPLPFHIKGRLWQAPYEDYGAATSHNLLSFPLFYFRDAVLIHIAVIGGLAWSGRWRELAPFWVPLYLMALYSSTTLQIMGYAHRYYIPVSCALLVVAVMAWRPRNPMAAPTRPLTPVYLTGVGVFAALAVAYLLMPMARLGNAGLEFYRPHITISGWLNRLPEGTTVAATEIGRIGAENPHIVIYDLAGLNDPEFARGFSVEDLFSRKPDVITLVHGDYGGINRAIRQDPRFADYEIIRSVSRHTPAASLHDNLFLSRNSPRYGDIKAVLSESDPS